MFRKSDFGFITDSNCSYLGIHKKSYVAWKNMIHRCYNKKNKRYKNYGGVGIVICDEWHLYSNFEKWYDENYVDSYQIDKDINMGGCYSPENCVFVSKSENISEKNRRADYSFMKKTSGANHYMNKTKLHYETFAVTRTNFKQRCIVNGWNICDFEEIYSGIKSSCRSKKYFYKEMIK